MPAARSQIGVVVPTYNSAATLNWTLCSLRNQGSLLQQVIVADSGSQDATLDICKKWGVETIYVPPGNMYRAINAGLRQLDCEWVTYLNSDDMVYRDSYARLVSLGENQGASLVYGDCDFVDFEGRYLFTVKSPPASGLSGMVRVSPLFSGRIGFAQPAAIFRRSTFEELNGFDEQYSNIGDYDFFFRLVTSGRPVAKLQRPGVAAFRLHASQLSVRAANNLSSELKRFRRNLTVKPSLRGLLDISFWRVRNSPSYVSRLLHMRP